MSKSGRDSIADAIVAEALAWLGTPYRHQGARKGVGCDCLGLVRGVWRAVYGDNPEEPGPKPTRGVRMRRRWIFRADCWPARPKRWQPIGYGGAGRDARRSGLRHRQPIVRRFPVD